ncbi:cobalamin biosynthesis protein [Actinoplanes oblitus]|uniref:Cobalamin biosynthesis protein n=1 Tax=Actinoplanes oblitus TaxID=3040509 RepID=A0ABY8W7L1_9ACTN|nr:cobalamin biosynthesis protein [Actinoplanes oblitus]WIM93849.1 cobalamin biosynthesis protein [Actinoplanes oblitus]
MIAVGIGARAGTGVAELATAVAAALAEAGLEVLDGTVLATLDRRAAEPGVRELSRVLGWRLVAFGAGELAGQAVPGPSRVVAAVVGTPSVAEAAALLAAGTAAELVLPKRVRGGVTVAIARGGPRAEPG